MTSHAPQYLFNTFRFLSSEPPLLWTSGQARTAVTLEWKLALGCLLFSHRLLGGLKELEEIFVLETDI